MCKVYNNKCTGCRGNIYEIVVVNCKQTLQMNQSCITRTKGVIRIITIGIDNIQTPYTAQTITLTIIPFCGMDITELYNRCNVCSAVSTSQEIFRFVGMEKVLEFINSELYPGIN